MKHKRWYKKLWIWLIGIIAIAGPILINEAYKVNSGYSTLWNAADVLLYYGSFLGAAGTKILGAVA